MNEHLLFFFYLLVCAGVTYLIRMLPLLFCRKDIKNRYVKSFLYYIPYSVLTAMTFPAIFYSTGMLVSALVGTGVAVVLAYLPSNKCEFEKYSADDTMLPEGIEKVPQKFAINYRNKWMIEHSDCVVTYVKHNLGGAARFKEYAIKKNKIVIDLVEKSLP